MTETYEMYLPVDVPDGVVLDACPVCGSPSSLTRYSKSPTSRTETVVCCSNGELFGPQTAALYAGCLLFMPPQEFYGGTIREAVKYWNEYSAAVKELRKENGT